MSVTAGSLGTADVPVSNPSLDGLDRVNFFLAAMLAGFGPYVAAYLANEKWPQAEIGLVLSAGSVAALLSQARRPHPRAPAWSGRRRAQAPAAAPPTLRRAHP